MKSLITDANFPRTSDGRTYHVGLKHGELANRIITVGDPSRAQAIAAHFDELTPPDQPFKLLSERGFLTITGTFHGTPISIVAIGMGSSNMDFFVRECREVLEGDMIIIRMGSCGGLKDIPVGSVVVPRTALFVARNYDFDFCSPIGESSKYAYLISKPVDADADVHEALMSHLSSSLAPANITINGDVLNASADSFYSSQGRLTSFPDHNEHLIDHLSRVSGVDSLEMETFHLLHLASLWPRSGSQSNSTTNVPPNGSGAIRSMIPPTSMPSKTSGSATDSPHSPNTSSASGNAGGSMGSPDRTTPPGIRAAAVHMVYASRSSQDFITPETVKSLQLLVGSAVLETLASIDIPADRLHPTKGSVWANPASGNQ